MAASKPENESQTSLKPLCTLTVDRWIKSNERRAGIIELIEFTLQVDSYLLAVSNYIFRQNSLAKFIQSNTWTSSL